MPGYVYAVKDDALYVNLYVADRLETKVKGREVKLSQSTAYPWEGDVEIRIDANKAGRFTMKLRIPGWVRGEVVPSDLYTFADLTQTHYIVKVNGQEVSSELQDGYFCIDRKWQEGDLVTLHMDMQPRLVRANEAVRADRGRLAVERGPVVYCAEWPDNGIPVSELTLSSSVPLSVEQQASEPGGIRRIHAGDAVLIPYFAWAHRGRGEMAVWLEESAE